MTETTVRLVFHLDGKQVASVTRPTAANQEDMKFLLFWAGEGSVWLDDVKLWSGFAPPQR